MKAPNRWMALGLLGAMVWGGCASTSPEAGFTAVADEVAARTGYRVAWYQGAAPDQEVSAALAALAADTLHLDEAVQLALLNNRRLQATYEALGVSQADVVQAGLLRNPVFDGDLAFPVAGGLANLAFGVAFDFLDVFYIPLRKAVAASAFESTRLRVAAAVLDMTGMVRGAFYQAQAQAQDVELLQQVVASTEAAYLVARRIHEAGNIRRLDLDRQQALYEAARLDLRAAEGALEQSREVLNAALGLWGEQTTWMLSPRLPLLPHHEAPLDSLERDVVAASLDLAIARQEITTLGHRLGLTEATALIPDLEVGGVSEREEGEWKVGPLAEIPLPLFDRGKARKARARAQLRQQQEAYTALAVESRAAARQTRHQLLTVRQEVQHYQDVLLPLRQRITEASQTEYNAMQIGVLALLEAKEEEIRTGRAYIDALHRYWTTRTELDLLRQGRMMNASTPNRAETSTTPSPNAH